MNRMLSLIATLALVAVGTGSARAADKLPPLDEALRDNATKIVKDLHQHKYKNVGVLKFLVRTGDGPARDNAGPLNSSLADRLEVALTLALDDNTLGIIANASKGVSESGNKRATHLTPQGRKELFTIRKKNFQIPWNVGEGVEPDAFLTGEAQLSPDRRTIKVVVQRFDRAEPEKLVPICEFTAASDLRTLTETGVTFATRGAFDEPEVLIAKATETAPQPDDKADTLQKKADIALADLEKSPIKLEILYDKVGQTVRPSPVPADKSSALLSLPTPKASQKVSFRLTNTDRDTTYGVVLKINGQNTIKREQQDGIDCKKWILKGGESVTIAGFQLNDKDSDEFKVQTPYESELNAVNYGDNSGTITLVAFRAGKAEEVLVKNDVAVATISRGMLSLHNEPKATDLGRFQDQLKKEAGDDMKEARTRGIVTGSGNIGNNPVDQVEFTPNPIPVLSATIRYYDPRQK
jgi:hypothetical protein